jgi:hypothetical protein
MQEGPRAYTAVGADIIDKTRERAVFYPALEYQSF